MFADDLFADRVAFVTGGGRGIGAAIAVELASLGADVGVVDLDRDAAADTVDAVTDAGGDGVAVAGDVGEPDAVADAVDTVEAELGPIRHAVNNAGTNSDADLVDLPLEEWRRVMRVNVDATFDVGRTVARRLAAADRDGSLVNIASITGTMPQPGAGAYSPSKAAVMMLTRQMALEWARDGIRVNAICPGLIWTPATDPVYSDDELLEARREWVPLDRIGEPADIATAAAFLLAPENRYTTGESLFVDGGANCVGLDLIPGRAQHE